MKDHDFRVEADAAGTRLDQFLAAQVPALSRARIQDMIKTAHVTLNGATTKPGARLKTGDAILLTEPPPAPIETTAEDIALDVLFEDDDLIVINKPAGLVVHPAAGNWSGTLVNALLHHCLNLSGIGGEQRPGIVHRLDKETSGCLVAAKNDAAHQSLARQFARREVTKIYLAIATGRFSRKSGTVDAVMGRHPVNRKRMAVVTAHGPGLKGAFRPSKTTWHVLSELPAGTLVECTLHTGRTHQIRVHLKHLGHPVVGDELYGKRGDFPRQMLHAWRLGFAHPRTGERLNFESPIPADFVEAGVPATFP